MYKIFDDVGQFCGGELFTTKEKARQALADFHSIDWTDELRGVEDLSLEELLEYGQWSIEEITTELTDEDKEEIGRQVEQGVTSGILDNQYTRISWELKYEKFINN